MSSEREHTNARTSKRALLIDFDHSQRIYKQFISNMVHPVSQINNSMNCTYEVGKDDCMYDNDKKTVLFFFLGVFLIWASVFLCSVYMARYTYSTPQAIEGAQQRRQRMKESIVTKRAVSLPETIHIEDEEKGGGSIVNDDAVTVQECCICMNLFQENLADHRIEIAAMNFNMSVFCPGCW